MSQSEVKLCELFVFRSKIACILTSKYWIKIPENIGNQKDNSGECFSGSSKGMKLEKSLKCSWLIAVSGHDKAVHPL